MIVIRNAQEQEAEVLAAIGLRAWRQATTALGITTTLYDNAASAFSNFTRSSWLAIRVAEFGGAVAGWAAREHFNEAISDFWIDPDFQRRGIGSLLLADIERQILQRDFETIRLETHAQNEPAVAFFRHHGYSVNWLSVSYAPKLDRDVQSVGLQKQSGRGRERSLWAGILRERLQAGYKPYRPVRHDGEGRDKAHL